jgi:hypothetical protein
MWRKDFDTLYMKKQQGYSGWEYNDGDRNGDKMIMIGIGIKP